MYLSYSLPTDVMTTVFKVGAKTEKGWSFLLSKYVSIGSEAEKNKILEALASSEDVRKLYWYEITQGIWYIETKGIVLLDWGSHFLWDHPFSTFTCGPDLTWKLWGGARMCWALSQELDLYIWVESALPERDWEMPEITIPFYLKTFWSAWHVAFDSTLSASFYLFILLLY